MESSESGLAETSAGLGDGVEGLRSFAAQGRWAELEVAGADLLAAYPTAHEAMALLAYGQQQQGHFEQALLLCRAAARVDQDLWLTNFVAGVCLKALGRHWEAYSYFQRAAVASPEDMQTQHLLTATRDILDGVAIASLENLRSLAAQRRWEELELSGQNRLKAQPDDHETLAIMGYAQQQQGQQEAALAWCERAAALAPQLWIANFVAGIALRELGRNAESYAYLARAAAAAPEDGQTLRALTGAQTLVEGIDAAAAGYLASRDGQGGAEGVVLAPILSIADFASRTGMPFRSLGAPETIPFEVPKVWGRPDEPFTAEVQSNSPYVGELADVRIFSRSDLILTKDGAVLNDAAAHPRFGQHVDLGHEAVVISQQDGRVLIDFNAYEACDLDAGIWLSGSTSAHFGHWLPEFLPKLQFLQEHPAFSTLPIIIDTGMPASHIDHLRRLTDRPLFELPANTVLRCGRLIVAPSPTFYPAGLIGSAVPVQEISALSPRALRFLRGSVLPAPDVRQRRLFLGRKLTTWRRLLNEAEISEGLEQLGFETIYIENLTAQEQIDLFSQAEWIVAPNGSSLLNLIFARPDVGILVLSQGNLFNWGNFQGPMSVLGYRPMFVCGEQSEAVDEKHADYRISMRSVRDALAALGLKENAA